jgi:hypothetical protein
MKLFTLIIIAGLAFAPAISNAQDTTKPAKTKMDRRKAMKEKWANATPEQKEKAKEKAKEKKAKFDSLPPEKQKEIKDKIKARKEKRNG